MSRQDPGSKNNIKLNLKTCFLLFQPSRITLNAGSFSLHLDEAEGQLWIGCSVAPYTVPMNTELFGFGSGDFAKGSEAQDLMTADGRWLRYFMDTPESLVILEKQRKTPDHLENAAFFNKDHGSQSCVWGL